MSISLARLNANRANAQKSTGPQTVEGKERSRQNAIKHGLTGDGIVLPEDEAEAVADRLERWSQTLEPANDLEAWLVGRMALAAVRLDRCHPQELAERALKAVRARSCWDEDRHLAAEQLAARLPSDPHGVVRQLRQSKQGCDWLISAWQELEAAVGPHGWSPADCAQALLLLGTPFGETAFAALLPDDPEMLRQIARAEIRVLEQLKTDVLDDLDRCERTLAETGARFDANPPARLLARYEAMHWRAFQWILTQLARLREQQPEPSATASQKVRPAQAAPLPPPEPQPRMQPQQQAEAPAIDPVPTPVSPAPSSPTPPAPQAAAQSRPPDATRDS